MIITENVVLAFAMMDGAIVCQINSDVTSNVAHRAVSALKESASSAQKASEYATTTAAHLTASAQNLVVAGSVGTDASSGVHMIDLVFQVVAFVSLGVLLTSHALLVVAIHQIHHLARLGAHLANHAFLAAATQKTHSPVGLDVHLISHALQTVVPHHKAAAWVAVRPANSVSRGIASKDKVAARPANQSRLHR